MSAPLYLLRGIEAGYGQSSVLHVPELTIERGSILGLAGHNGSGKSTLLKLLGFLLVPSAGELSFDGRVLDAAALRGLKLRGQRATPDRLAEALDLVGLDFAEFGPRSWRELSGGEARRVALAARLVLQPEALLLDEPTTGLDRSSVAHVQRAVLAARETRGATLVIASHDVDWLRSCADRVLLMDDGRIIGVL